MKERQMPKADATEATSVDEIPVPTEAELEAEEPKEEPTAPAEGEPGTEEAGEGEAEGEPEGKSEPEAGEGESEAEPEGEAEPDDSSAAQARRGYAERAKLRGEVNDALATSPDYVPQTPEQLVEQGASPQDAAIESMRQEMVRDRIVNQTVELNASLNMDANNVLRDFPVFDPANKDQFDAKFAKDVEDMYKRAAGFQTDPSGKYVLSSNMPLYDFYQWAASLRGSGVQTGAAKGQKAAEKMLASAEAPASSNSSASSDDKPKGEDALFLAGLTGKSGTYSKSK